MATTGTASFSVTRDDIIKAALRSLGVIGVGETPITEDYTNCSQALNIMIKGWAKKGVPLWVTSNLTLPLVSGVGQYPIGLTAGYVSSVTITSGGSGYGSAPTVTFSAPTSGTTATGTASITGGVITTITITNAGSGYTTAPTITFGSGSATATATIVGLTTNKPVRTFGAYIRDSNNIDVDVKQIAENEYDLLGNKSQAGKPNQFYYDNQLTNGQLYVYPVPDVSTYTLYVDVQRNFYDMTSSTDTFDFPQEWFQTLKWGLAAELCVEYGVPPEMISYYEQKAVAFLTESLDFSVEEPSVFFTMDRR